MSLHQNCTGIPVVVESDEMVLFIRSDVMASTNVQALAVLFNIEKADIPYRTFVIPKEKWMLNDDDYAVRTTSDFFQVYQIDYLTSTQWDPQGLKTNAWLTNRAIISFSPFVPIVVFSSSTQTSTQTITVTPTTFSLSSDKESELHLGDKALIRAVLNGNITPETDKLQVMPDAYTYTLKLLAEGNDYTCLSSSQNVTAPKL